MGDFVWLCASAGGLLIPGVAFIGREHDSLLHCIMTALLMFCYTVVCYRLMMA